MVSARRQTVLQFSGMSALMSDWQQFDDEYVTIDLRIE
jgi:hypothetical protein